MRIQSTGDQNDARQRHNGGHQVRTDINELGRKPCRTIPQCFQPVPVLWILKKTHPRNAVKSVDQQTVDCDHRPLRKLSERSMITVNSLLIDAFDRIPGMRFFEDPKYRDRLETLRDRSTWLPSQFINISSNLVTAVMSLAGVVLIPCTLDPQKNASPECGQKRRSTNC